MRKILSFILLLFATNPAQVSFAQDVEQLPVDPRVKTGTLSNGLKYFLYKNAGTPGYADFILAQEIGDNAETSEQFGMMKMIELLSLRGTRNFPDTTIISYLNSIGVSPNNLEFRTNHNNTSYAIRNIPIKNSSTTDSTLLILYNWMNAINFDEEDINKANILYRNKYRNYWTADNRLTFMEEQDFLSKSSQSKNQKPWELVPNFSSKELRNFYYKWFRPDNQAIIISGDIDPESLQTRITSLFSSVPKPLEAKPVANIPSIKDNKNVSIQKDKEYNKVSVSINFIKPSIIDKYKNTSVPYIQEFMNKSILNILSARIADGVLKNNIPVWNVNCGTGDVPYTKDYQSIFVSFETLPENIYTTLSFLSSEIDRMARHGFNNQELTKSKDLYFRELELQYDNRFKQPNKKFTDWLTDHYLNGTSLGSPELKFEIMKEITYSITATQLNEYAKSLLGNKDNIKILCRIPDRNSINNISEGRIYNTFKESIGISEPTKIEENIVNWPDIPYEKNDINKITESSNTIAGTTNFLLPNGVKVIFKQTSESGDTISVRAVSKGGFSKIDGITLSSERYLNDILKIGGLADIKEPDVRRLYNYNDMNINAKILLNKEMIFGYAPKKNIENLFKALYLNFAKRRKDYEAFDLYKKVKLFEYEYDALSPDKIFKDTVTYYNNSNKTYVGQITQKDIESLDYDKMLEQIDGRFENASDFVFIVTGDIDKNIIKELSNKYLQLLHSNKNNNESTYTVPSFLTKGSISKSFLARMEVPRCYLNITNSIEVEYNERNYILAILSGVYIQEMINKSAIKGITTGISTQSKIIDYPENIYVLNTNIVADSSYIVKIKEAYEKILNDIAENGVNKNIFTNTANIVKNRFKTIRNTNTYWMDIIEKEYLSKTNFDNDFIKNLEGIKHNNLSDFLKKLIINGNTIDILMEGTTEDVKTKNLFREDPFIKDFFGYYNNKNF